MINNRDSFKINEIKAQALEAIAQEQRRESNEILERKSVAKMFLENLVPAELLECFEVESEFSGMDSLGRWKFIFELQSKTKKFLYIFPYKMVMTITVSESNLIRVFYNSGLYLGDINGFEDENFRLKRANLIKILCDSI